MSFHASDLLLDLSCNEPETLSSIIQFLEKAQYDKKQFLQLLAKIPVLSKETVSSLMDLADSHIDSDLKEAVYEKIVSGGVLSIEPLIEATGGFDLFDETPLHKLLGKIINKRGIQKREVVLKVMKLANPETITGLFSNLGITRFDSHTVTDGSKFIKDPRFDNFYHVIHGLLGNSGPTVVPVLISLLEYEDVEDVKERAIGLLRSNFQEHLYNNAQEQNYFPKEAIAIGTARTLFCNLPQEESDQFFLSLAKFLKEKTLQEVESQTLLPLKTPSQIQALVSKDVQDAIKMLPETDPLIIRDRLTDDFDLPSSTGGKELSPEELEISYDVFNRLYAGLSRYAREQIQNMSIYLS